MSTFGTDCAGFRPRATRPFCFGKSGRKPLSPGHGPTGSLCHSTEFHGCATRFRGCSKCAVQQVAADSEKSEAYGAGTSRTLSNENAAGRLFQQPLCSNSARQKDKFGTAAQPCSDRRGNNSIFKKSRRVQTIVGCALNVA